MKNVYFHKNFMKYKYSDLFIEYKKMMKFILREVSY